MSLFSCGLEENYQWAKKFLAGRSPDFRFRWEYYFSLLEENLVSAPHWLDAGAGENQTIEQYNSLDFKIGVDRSIPLVHKNNFVRA